MTKSNVESDNKFVVLILPIADNNYKVRFCLLVSISLHIYLLGI